MFKVGQKVVCIATQDYIAPECINNEQPIVGNIYTVNYKCFDHVGFKELPQDDMYESDKFRPLDESFAEEVLESIKQQIEEEELILNN